MLRQCVGNHVCHTWLVFHRKIKAQELAYPLMLGNCCELLIKKELEDVMIGADDERAAPEVGSLVEHDENQLDEFMFIRGEGHMAGGELAAEECHQTTTLM
jgi:hypothetical protein